MISLRYLFLSVLFCWFTFDVYAQDLSIDELFTQLDREIDKKHTYEVKYEEKISEVRNHLNSSLSDEEVYKLHKSLYEMYCFYDSDSSFYYASSCVQLAQKIKDPEKETEARFNLAFTYSATGLFTDAYLFMANEDLDKLSPEMKIKYYEGMVYYNYHFSEYAKKGEIGRLALRREIEGYEILMSMENPNSEKYLFNSIQRNLLQKNPIPVQQKKKFIQTLNTLEKGTRHYALNSLITALIFESEGNKEEYIRYLLYSAIADIQSANREVYSLQCLAQVSFEAGEIDRAYRYVRVCLENAQFYDNRIRSMQIADMQDIINRAYENNIQKQQKTLYLFLGLLSVLIVGLVFAAFWILKQKRKITLSHEKLNEANELLHKTNQNLLDANLVKEEYIGRFMKLCAEYIDKMNEFRKLVNRKIKTGQVDDLLKMTSGSRVIENEQKELFHKFDTAFLHLYPDFVEEINALLREEERFEIKKDELLSNELRICALIRLGIKDSCQIAEFTGYSVNTIYVYRTRMRNKAIVREEIENNIMKIGTKG